MELRFAYIQLHPQGCVIIDFIDIACTICNFLKKMVLNTLRQLELLGFHFWTPSGSSHHQAPYWVRLIPAALRKCIKFWLRDDKLTLVFPFFLNANFPKFLCSTLIIPHFWYFWKPAPYFCKERGVPIMLGVLSLSFIIPFFLSTHLFSKMCHPPRKIATINQLLKIDNFRINYSGENKIVLIYVIGYTFQHRKILHLL